MDQFTAHLDRGWDLVSRGDFGGALVSAQKSLELDGESPEAHNLVGYIHQAEGRADDALEHYRLAISHDETFVEAMLNAAEVLIHPLHDFEGALRMVEEALDYADAADEVADALLLRFDAMLHSGDRDAAKDVLRSLPEGPFENPHLDFLVGRAKFEAGDVPGAELHLAAATQRDPSNPEAFYYLGLTLEARGDSRGATASFLQAREADLSTPRPPWTLPAAQFERKVQSAIRRLPPPLVAVLEGALVVVSELPGPEVVAEGVDPHLGALVDDLQKDDGTPATPDHAPVRAGRLFIYQKNVERMASGLLDLEDELVRTIVHELAHAFPQLAPEDLAPGRPERPPTRR